MEQIGSWNEFLECRARLLGHLADVAKKCWHSEYIIGSYCEKYGDTYCMAGGPKSKVFGLKDKRLFYGAVRKVPKETILHLYMAAAKYLPGEVGRYLKIIKAHECRINGIVIMLLRVAVKIIT